MSDVGLIQLHLQFGQLLLTSGVEGNLSRSVASRLLQFFVELIKLSAQGATSLVSAGTRLALSLKFLIELLKPSLQLLNLGVQLPAKSLLVLDLAIEGAVLLFFALQNLAHLDLVPLKVSDSLLGELQVALHLPLELLNVSLLLLLSLPRVLDLIKAFLEPDLQLIEVVALVLKGLDLLLFLHLALGDRFLLLVELVDQFLLVKALLLHLLDLSVLVRLLVLHLGQPALTLSHLPTEGSLASLRLFQCLLKALDLLVFIVDLSIQGIDLLLKATLYVFKFGDLAQKILFGIGATSEGDLN